MMRYHNIRWGNELSLSGLPLLLQRWASHESAGFSHPWPGGDDREVRSFRVSDMGKSL